MKCCFACGLRYCRHTDFEFTPRDRKRRNELSRKRLDGTITPRERKSLGRLEEKARAYADRADTLQRESYDL